MLEQVLQQFAHLLLAQPLSTFLFSPRYVVLMILCCKDSKKGTDYTD